MGKLKRKQENNKISKQGLKIKCLFMNDHDTILFSFKYLTNQDRYNLQGFKGSKNLRSDIDFLNAFHDCLNRMGDRKSTRLNSSHRHTSRMPSSA